MLITKIPKSVKTPRPCTELISTTKTTLEDIEAAQAAGCPYFSDITVQLRGLLGLTHSVQRTLQATQRSARPSTPPGLNLATVEHLLTPIGESLEECLAEVAKFKGALEAHWEETTKLSECVVPGTAEMNGNRWWRRLSQGSTGPGACTAAGGGGDGELNGMRISTHHSHHHQLGPSSSSSSISTIVPPCPWPTQLGSVAEDTVQSLQWAMKQLQVQVGALVETTHEHNVQLVRESFCLQGTGSVFPTGHGR